MEWISWIPDLAALEAWLLGLLVGPVVLLGIPLVMATTRLPTALRIEPVDDSELSPAQRRWLADVTKRLQVLAFECVATFRVPNLPGANLARMYRCTTDATVAVAMAHKSENEAAVLAGNLVEFVSDFQDGTMVSTRPAIVDDLFDPLPETEQHVHRWTDDPAALKAHHDRHCAPYATRGHVQYTAEEMLPRFLEHHRRWVAHQVERGLLRVRDADSCGASFKLALRAVVAFFNPFGDRFTAARMVLGLLVGLAPPLLGSLVLALHPSALLPQLQAALGTSPELAELLALAPAFLLSAAAVGWIFESRAVVWSPILACVAGWLAVPASSEDPWARAVWLLTLIATSVAANALSNWRHRRQAVA